MNAVSMIIAFGALAVLVCALVRSLDETRRGLFCWTVSSLAYGLAAVVFFSQGERFSADFPQLIAGLGAAAACAALAFAAELAAPSKRLRRGERPAVDTAAGERSFNFVAVIICAVMALAAAVSAAFSRTAEVLVCVVPAAALSLRQLSYFLGTAGTGAQSERERVQALRKRLGRNDMSL